MATSRSFSCVAGRYSRQTARKQNVIEPSICGEPLLFSGYTQPKAFVAVGSDLIAFLLVRGDATDTDAHPAGRIRNTKKLLTTAAPLRRPRVHVG